MSSISVCEIEYMLVRCAAGQIVSGCILKRATHSHPGLISPFFPSQPYQGGIPSFAQPSSAPLPQTFQSLLSNPSVKTPAVPWTLSRQEKKDYDQIFRAWTGGEGGGFIEGGMAQDVFGQSGLGREDLGKIW